jgi:hypothetical protein
VAGYTVFDDQCSNGSVSEPGKQQIVPDAQSHDDVQFLSYLIQNYITMINNERYQEKFRKIWRASFFTMIIIWTVVILLTVRALQGTVYVNRMVSMPGLGAAASIIVLTGILRRYLETG